jgi:hypothetical protein
MPLQYSIKDKHPTITSGPDSVVYLPAPKEVAESHEDGCYALSNMDGERVSPWAYINIITEPEKRSFRTEVKDALKHPLSIGDYVGYNANNVNSPITIGKVLGFTNKQVRVMKIDSYKRQYSELRYESSLIRLPEEYWTGTL